MALRRLLVLVLTLVAVGLGAPAAYACSCAAPPDYATAVAEADVAFTGEVVSVSGNRYGARVDGVIKGRLPAHVTLHAESRDSASCGRTLQRGPIVYVGTRDLLVAACMSIWTGPHALPVAARAETYAPDPSAPDPGRGRTGPVLLAVAALTVVGVAHRRARRRVAT